MENAFSTRVHSLTLYSRTLHAIKTKTKCTLRMRYGHNVYRSDAIAYKYEQIMYKI